MNVRERGFLEKKGKEIGAGIPFNLKVKRDFDAFSLL